MKKERFIDCLQAVGRVLFNLLPVMIIGILPFAYLAPMLSTMFFILLAIQFLCVLGLFMLISILIVLVIIDR